MSSFDAFFSDSKPVLDGNIISDTGYRPGIATIKVNLDEGYDYWATGDYKKKYPRLKECFYKRRKPETYGELVKR